MSRVLNQLKAVIPHTGAVIWVIENNTFTPLVYQGPIPQEKILNLAAPLIGKEASRALIRDQKLIRIPDTQSDTPSANALRTWSHEQLGDEASDVRAWMGIPLVIKDRAIGIFALHHNRPNHYTTEQIKLAQIFADYVTIAMENNRLYQQASTLATLEERTRLARELHDNTAQALGYMNLKVSVINQLLSNQQVKEAQNNLKELKQLIQDTYTDVREEIFSLRTTASLDLGFLDTLRKYIEKYNQYYDLDIHLEVDDDDESKVQFTPAVSGQIIRVIQESLINVRKHARVNTVIIRVSKKNSYACIWVQDQGVGFEPKNLSQSNVSGFGLQIMRERAESIGGSLEIKSTPGQGVEIVIWAPLASGGLPEPDLLDSIKPNNPPG